MPINSNLDELLKFFKDCEINLFPKDIKFITKMMNLEYTKGYDLGYKHGVQDTESTLGMDDDYDYTQDDLNFDADREDRYFGHKL
jgi:hypothetical protein